VCVCVCVCVCACAFVCVCVCVCVCCTEHVHGLTLTTEAPHAGAETLKYACPGPVNAARDAGSNATVLLLLAETSPPDPTSTHRHCPLALTATREVRLLGGGSPRVKCTSQLPELATTLAAAVDPPDPCLSYPTHSEVLCAVTRRLPSLPSVNTCCTGPAHACGESRGRRKDK
jgi:hypothetical protein